jgi:hypothetical protein
MSIWKYLLAGGVGFGVAKLIGGIKKTQSEPSSSSSSSNKSTTTSSDWKEELQDAIDKDGVLYTFTDYSDWKEIKSKSFQTALTNYKKDLKSFQSVINGLPKNQKEYVDGVIDKEGFDYAFDGYSNFNTFSEYGADGKFAKDTKFTNLKFQNARKQYLKSYRALLRVVNR